MYNTPRYISRNICTLYNRFDNLVIYLLHVLLFCNCYFLLLLFIYCYLFIIISLVVVLLQLQKISQVARICNIIGLGLGLLGFNASATARVISRR